METVDREPCVGPVDNANIAMVLVEANLVTPSDNGDDMPLVGKAQAMVEQSAAEKKRKQRRRLLRILGLVLVASGITAGVTLGINSNRPTPLPSSSIYQVFANCSNPFLPTPHSSRRIRPHPYTWHGSGWSQPTFILTDPDVSKLRQRFALACFPLLQRMPLRPTWSINFLVHWMWMRATGPACFATQMEMECKLLYQRAILWGPCHESSTS